MKRLLPLLAVAALITFALTVTVPRTAQAADVTVLSQVYPADGGNFGVARGLAVKGWYRLQCASPCCAQVFLDDGGTITSPTCSSQLRVPKTAEADLFDTGPIPFSGQFNAMAVKPMYLVADGGIPLNLDGGAGTAVLLRVFPPTTGTSDHP